MRADDARYPFLELLCLPYRRSYAFGVLARASEKPASIVAVRGKAQFEPSDARFLSIGVLVDLERSVHGGGHVKCWERLAEAATRSPEPLDLTVYMQGPPRVEHLGPQSRIVTLRPVFSTRTLGFLKRIPDHTDLAPVNPRLLRHLMLHDVLHTTDAYFAFTRTARLAARLRPIALVNSVHSAVPAYTRIYSEAVFRRWGLVGRALNGPLHMPERLERCMQARLSNHILHCRASLEADRPNARGLRRGIDLARFSPARRDRHRLQNAFGIACDRLVLLFAGRLEDGKNVMVAAQAIRLLLDRGLPVHAIFAGAGRRHSDIAALLGPNVSLPGAVDQDDLAWLYASSDVFVFPSTIEVLPNVVLEAKASGLPVVVARDGGGRFVRQHGADGVIVADGMSSAWAEVIAALLAAPARRLAIGSAARNDIERFQPSWDTVLAEDLLPVWRAAVR